VCLKECFLIGSGPPTVLFLSLKFVVLLKMKRGTGVELEPRVGTPTWGGPLPRDFLKNPHYPRGYRVGSKPNLPTRYFAEWVNKSTFFVTKLYDRVSKRCFLVETIHNWLR